MKQILLNIPDVFPDAIKGLDFIRVYNANDVEIAVSRRMKGILGKGL